MSNELVYVNLDRNGNVASIEPEAVLLRNKDCVTYQLREPSATNWEFIGAQFAECTNDFSGVEVNGNQLTLREHTGKRGHKVEVTLLYVLADTRYYGSGDDPSQPPHRNVKKLNSVHAFDPLIIHEN